MEKTKGRFSNITTTQGPQKKLCHKIDRNSNGGNCHQIERTLKTTTQNVNPFTARVLDGVLKGDCNFCVCGRNPTMWPFKWKLPSCTFTWYLFVFTMLKNEIWKYGRNLPLTTFGSERIKRRYKKPSIYERRRGWTNLKKIRTDCNCAFSKPVWLTVFQSSIMLFVMIDLMIGRHNCLR